MARKHVYGKCRICGKDGKLTFEHIPPSATYNKQSVKMFKMMDLLRAESENEALPWELERAPAVISQRGRGYYCLCEKCNNITGSWYAAHYKRFIDALMYIYMSSRNGNYKAVSLNLLGMRPLPIFKQIMTMFCDINVSFTDSDETLRDFILNKESRSIDTKKYRIFMYLMNGGIEKIVPRVAAMKKGLNSPILLTEISAIPAGFILYEDLPEDYHPPLTEITNFINCKYNDKAEIQLSLNIYETNTFFPEDFRSKQEILSTKEKNDNSITNKDSE